MGTLFWFITQWTLHFWQFFSFITLTLSVIQQQNATSAFLTDKLPNCRVFAWLLQYLWTPEITWAWNLPKSRLFEQIKPDFFRVQEPGLGTRSTHFTRTFQKKCYCLMAGWRSQLQENKDWLNGITGLCLDIVILNCHGLVPKGLRCPPWLMGVTGQSDQRSTTFVSSLFLPKDVTDQSRARDARIRRIQMDPLEKNMSADKPQFSYVFLWMEEGFGRRPFGQLLYRCINPGIILNVSLQELGFF